MYSSKATCDSSTNIFAIFIVIRTNIQQDIQMKINKFEVDFIHQRVTWKFWTEFDPLMLAQMR